MTVVSIGYLLHWMIPEMPLVAAFALAAVLSPTDAVALSGIVGEDRIPKKLMGILQGEALMNDASALVSLKFAVAIAMGTMVFSVAGATLAFLQVALGGLLAGIGVAWIYSKSLVLLGHQTDDDAATQIVLLLLLPFAAYLIAEHFGVSGILAAVASGMTMSRTQLLRQAPLNMRLRANGVWNMLEFVFNGMVFLMLGLQLPGVIEESIVQAELDPTIETWMLFADILLVYCALLLLRFAWLWLVKLYSRVVNHKHPMLFARYTSREIWISTFAGVRGAITLAGVLSVPLYLSDGVPFPSRYQLVFIATGVILFSLLCGVLALPLLLKGITLTDHSMQKKEERIARVTMAQVAIDSLKKMQERLAADREENLDEQVLAEVSARVIGMLHRRVAGTDELENSMAIENLERRFRLAAVNAERAELYHLRATQRISNETLQKMLRELDLLEAVLSEKV